MSCKIHKFYKGEIICFNILPYINFGKADTCKFINIGWLFWNIQIKF